MYFLGDGVLCRSSFAYGSSSASLSSTSFVDSLTSIMGKGLSSRVRTRGGVVRPTYVSFMSVKRASWCRSGTCPFSISDTQKNSVTSVS